MSVNFGHKITSMYGYGTQVHLPVIPTDCGYRMLGNESTGGNADEISALNIMATARAVRNCEAWVKENEKYPAVNDHVPYIYERDSGVNSAWADTRVAMIQTVLENDKIHSISFKPEHPELTQTWFFKRGPFTSGMIQVLSPQSRTNKQRDMHFISGRVESALREEENRSDPVGGFLRPFSGYNLRQVPDPALDTKMPIYISSVEDLTDLPELETVRRIADQFLKDNECQALALTILVPTERRVEKIILGKLI